MRASAVPQLVTSPVPEVEVPPPGSERIVFRPNVTQTRFRAREVLLGRNFFSEAVGTAPGEGTILVTRNRTVIPTGSMVKVDLTQLRSDEPERDAFVKSIALEVDRFPEATFVPRSVSGMPERLPDSRSVAFQLAGDLTIHGVTRPSTWTVAIDLVEADSLTGTAGTNVKLQDFGIEPPRVPIVVTVEDIVSLEISFVAAREVVPGE